MFNRFRSSRQPVQVSSGRPALQPGDTRQYEIATAQMIGEIAVTTFTVDLLSLQHGVAHLADMLDDLVQSGVRHLVLDLQNVHHMDSSCVGCMVETLNKLARSGGRIALANADFNVAYLFRLTRLDRVFPICNDVMTAVNAIERQVAQQ